jgi:hypothetical protein
MLNSEIEEKRAERIEPGGTYYRELRRVIDAP